MVAPNFEDRQLTRVTRGKRAWGVQVSKNWWRLLLLIAGLVAVGLVLGELFWN